MSALIKLYLKVFLRMGIPFAILMTLFDLINKEASVIGFIRQAVYFGGLMSVTFGTLHAVRVWKSTKTRFSEEDLDAHQLRKLETNTTRAEFRHRLSQDPVLSKGEVQEIVEGIIIKTRMSWQSWGEVIKITFREITNKHFDVEIDSKPKISGTLLDYGKNRRNVQRVENLLKNI